MKDQTKTPLFDAIVSYIEQQNAYFRIPGHRGEVGINQKWLDYVGPNIFKMDLTETPLLDDLHNPSGAIREAEELAQDVFGAESTYFLINGTTCGNEAMLMTAASLGEKILIPRNAHKSALMGMIISGADPIYIMPELSEEWGVHGGLDVHKIAATFAEHPDIKGMMAVSPTYYGLCSNLKEIARICHEYQAALLVDEAHGAHLYFSGDLPDGAMTSGADVCAQSIHKVTGSLTQSSMLHINSRILDKEKLEANLHIVQSTSPSYLLMASLDLARQDLAVHGPQMIANALELSHTLREAVNRIPGFCCFGEEIVGHAGIYGLDSTRLTISGKEIGITGFALKELLFSEHGVDVELCDYLNVLAIITYANCASDTRRLIKALQEIGLKHGQDKILRYETKLPTLPEKILSPREAFFAKTRRIPWQEAQGKIAAEMIAPYPPGIPTIYPGEIISNDVWEYIEMFRQNNRHLQGPADHELKTFKIIDQ